MKLRRQLVPFTTEEAWLAERAQDLTSTECAALFGHSPYTTPFELWWRKHDNLALKLDPNERMNWGTRLQDAIALGVAEDQGWARKTVRRVKAYTRLPDLRLGASIDFKVGKRSILEIKNVDNLVFRDDWQKAGGVIEAPVHIELQVQHQMLVHGKDSAFIAALVGGNHMVLLERKAEPAIHEAILKRSAEFWNSVSQGLAPQPEWQADSDFIFELLKRTAPGKTVDVTGEEHFRLLALTYIQERAKESAADLAKTGLKAEIVTLMGDAEIALGAGFKVTSKQNAETGKRSFTLNERKVS